MGDSVHTPPPELVWGEHRMTSLDLSPSHFTAKTPKLRMGAKVTLQSQGRAWSDWLVTNTKFLKGLVPSFWVRPCFKSEPGLTRPPLRLPQEWYMDQVPGTGLAVSLVHAQVT